MGEHTKHVVVIGAGPGGLAVSILLASAGARVTLLERLPILGGRTSCLEANGYKFDLGPTFFLYPRVLQDIYKSAGADLAKEVPMVRLDPQYRIQFASGGKLDCTQNVERMEKEIAAISPQDYKGFRRFLTENRTKLAAMEPCLETPYSCFGDVCNTRFLKMLPLIRPHQSLDTYLHRFFKDPRIRLAFSFQSKYLGMSPFRCPSLFSILSFLEYEYGVYHPIGGCSSVTASMARVAESLGVQIRLGEPVREMLFNGRRACGARTDSGVIKADAVVMNADFARGMERMVPNHLRRKWTNEKIAKKKFSCSTFMMYLGVEGECDVPHHTIHIAENYRRNLEEIEEQHVLSEDPSFYIQNACVTDKTLAPKGHSALYLLAPVTHEHPNVDWSREKQRFRNLLLRQAAKAGYADIEKRIRYERIITPADWNSTYEIYRGATFNLAHSLDQMLHLRPQNRFEDLDGVYLVGGGTHPGSGLPVIFESARITSRLLTQDLGLRTPNPPLRKSDGETDRVGAYESA